MLAPQSVKASAATGRGWISRLRISFSLLTSSLALLVLFPLMANGQEQHPFWDRTNIRMHLLNLAAQSVDAYSTQKALRRGAKEINPIASPFANRGWKGQVIYSYGIGVGGTLAASYLFHRWGLHKHERITPILVAAPTGVMGGLNFRF